jgi:hypothetical protein
MPICVYGKSKKVKVGPTVEDINVKNCRSQSQQPRNKCNSTEVRSEHVEGERAGEPILVRSVKLFWIYA